MSNLSLIVAFQPSQPPRKNRDKHVPKRVFNQRKMKWKWVFEKFDTNKGGKISLEEYKAPAMALDKGLGDHEANQCI